VLTAEAIFGKDIATAAFVGESEPGIRIVGDLAEIGGSEIHDNIGGFFEAGIWGWTEKFDGGAHLHRTFWIDPVDGSIRVYGSGAFWVANEAGLDIGMLADTVYNIGYGNNKFMVMFTQEADTGVGFEVEGLHFVLDHFGNVHMSDDVIMDISNASLVIPIKSSSYVPSRDGEMWMVDG
jgi:hypothetical protein